MACGVALHRETGPGPLDTVYEAVLARDLEARGLRVARQVPIPIELRGIRFDEGFRADPVVENNRSCGTQIRGEGHKRAPQAGVDLSAVDGYQSRLSTRLRRGFDEGRHFPHHKRGH